MSSSLLLFSHSSMHDTAVAGRWKTQRKHQRNVGDAPDEALRWLLSRIRAQPPIGLGLQTTVKAHESTKRTAFYVSAPSNMYVFHSIIRQLHTLAPQYATETKCSLFSVLMKYKLAELIE